MMFEFDSLNHLLIGQSVANRNIETPAKGESRKKVFCELVEIDFAAKTHRKLLNVAVEKLFRVTIGF